MVTPCQHAIVLPYAAYLRVYEPLSAFPDADGRSTMGGLVYLLDDEALRADQSVAEVSAAMAALASGELEMATAMYRRLTSRWQVLAALEHAS